MTYKIVHATNLTILETRVQEFIDKGWKLAGSMVVSRAFYDENFYQPMTIDPTLIAKLRKEEANRRKY